MLKADAQRLGDANGSVLEDRVHQRRSIRRGQSESRSSTPRLADWLCTAERKKDHHSRYQARTTRASMSAQYLDNITCDRALNQLGALCRGHW